MKSNNSKEIKHFQTLEEEVVLGEAYHKAKMTFYKISKGIFFSILIGAVGVGLFFGNLDNGEKEIAVLKEENYFYMARASNCENDFKTFEQTCFDRQMEIINTCIYEEDISKLIKLMGNKTNGNY